MITEGYIGLEDGVFIRYTLTNCGGTWHCDTAQLDCTFENQSQVKECYDLLDEIGLDDEASFKAHVNQHLNLN